jgi:DNA invertase Pin-like site-specific DNA recombinase
MTDTEQKEEAPKFESIEEVMDYVEKEAQRRVGEILSKYAKLGETNAYDKVIIRLLKDFKQPLSVELISFLTGISKSRCCKVLNRLEKKWKTIRRVTVSKASYYALI